jgi:hypothetical protein
LLTFRYQKDNKSFYKSLLKLSFSFFITAASNDSDCDCPNGNSTEIVGTRKLKEPKFKKLFKN